MTQKLILFAENGDSVAETPGTLWDLLANAGGVDGDFDAQKMTVLFEDGASRRAMSLGPALAATMDDGERARTVEKLEKRAAGYTRLASWLRGVGPEETLVEEETPEAPAARSR